MPPAEYHEACLFAYCAAAPAGSGREERLEAICATLANYAQDCAARRVLLRWRKPGFCGRAPACDTGNRLRAFMWLLPPPPAQRPLWGLPGPPGPPGTAVSGVGRGAPRSSRPAPVPAERQCPGGQLYSDCASACPPSCSAVDDGGEGSCGEECVSGCECPPGLFWDGAVCVPAARCPCYHRRRRYNPGDTVRQLCNPWWVRGPCFRWG